MILPQKVVGHYVTTPPKSDGVRVPRPHLFRHPCGIGSLADSVNMGCLAGEFYAPFARISKAHIHPQIMGFFLIDTTQCALYERVT